MLQTFTAVALVIVLITPHASHGAQLLADGVYAKALAGPPFEFGLHAIPDPIVAAHTSDAVTYNMILVEENSPINASVQLAWRKRLVVDSTAGFSFTILSPVRDVFAFVLQDPKGADVPLVGIETETFMPATDSLPRDSNVRATVFAIQPARIGEYTLSVTSTLSAAAMAALYSNRTGNAAIPKIGLGFCVVFCSGQHRIFTHLSSYSMLRNAKIGLIARMYDTAAYPTLARGQAPAPLRDIVLQAEIQAVFPDGEVVNRKMYDDGLHGDFGANDGIFGGDFTALLAGEYSARVLLDGLDENGPFVRSTTHMIRIVPPSVKLLPSAFTAVDSERMVVYLPISGAAAKAQYRAYAELWGKSASGEDVAVCWISSMVNAQTVSGQSVFALEVDPQWVARSAAVAPFELRGAYVQEIVGFVPLDTAAVIPINQSSVVDDFLMQKTKQLLMAGYKGEISKEMRQGATPAELVTNSTAWGGSKLVLLHGFCASSNPFQVQSQDWTDALYFKRTGVGMVHDVYAKWVLAFVKLNGLKSFGLIGHSQGGVVSLHMMNYYHTGLDLSTGSRKIQSLGSPYLGNTAMGVLLDILKIFGMGCGVNYDLSLDGATLWFTGITTLALNETNVYTTQYDKGGLFGEGYCNMLTNAMMRKPNDGGAEQDYSIPPGGQHRGHTVGQCHLDDMEWPASFWDSARNQEMNAAAAR